ncbi:hypothetical protein LCGC14_1337400 [marine sediment metagenome]|uniref:Uncharacterized protein n=1 Tax=marine sediment metagenome TaxID=412755 RepID=A0A0F9MVJ9_9ZZZZ
MPAGWSYSGDPSKSDEDAVHFIIGDTDPKCPLVTDAEITWALSINGDNIYLAGLDVIDSAIVKFGRSPTFKVGDVSKNSSDIVKNLQIARGNIRRRASADAQPFFGGLSKSGKRTLEEDADAVQPSFRVGQDENPGTTDPIFREKTGLTSRD